MKSYFRIYTCCPNNDCDSFQNALGFLKSFGIEPALKCNDEGHCFDFSVPKKWTMNRIREFHNKLNEKVGVPLSEGYEKSTENCLCCNASCYKKSKKLIRNRDNREFFFCEFCMEHRQEDVLAINVNEL